MEVIDTSGSFSVILTSLSVASWQLMYASSLFFISLSE